MCGGGKSSKPAPQLPEAPTPPEAASEESTKDRDRRRRAAAGGTGTILTSSGGVQSNAPTQQKTLLGA
jgi:hypothetical protein